MADACSIQQTNGAIALGTPLLRIKWMIGGAEQASIGLKRKSRSWKAGSPRKACPLAGPYTTVEACEASAVFCQ